MTAAAIVIAAVLGVLLLSQGVLVAGFVLTLLRSRRPRLDDSACPPATIALCLRGADPFLGECIQALISQDYPDYELAMIVDSRDDPARPIAEEAARNARCRVTIEPLCEPRETCSLKCSSVVQAARSLPDRVEILALVDADTIAHATWLRELAAALADETVGAATGNRWYMPGNASLPSLVRYLWNAAAVVQMATYRIPWGGSLAVKTSVLKDGEILHRWSNSFCEDTMLFARLRERGLRVAFVPSLMMINRESCGLGGFFRWVRRQLLTARLYHPGWPLVAFHGLVTTAAPLAAIGLVIASLSAGNWRAAVIGGGALLAYEPLLFALIAPVEIAVRRIARRRGEGARWLTAGSLARLPLAAIMTQAVYAAALCSALLLRRVDWRGVSYAVDGPWSIRMEEYRPFAEPDTAMARSSL